MFGGVGESSPSVWGRRGWDVTQLGDVSSCYGNLYFAFIDDKRFKSPGKGRWGHSCRDFLTA